MSLVASEPKNDYEPVPDGVYIARCYKMIDLGTQLVQTQGKSKESRKALLGWELLDPSNIRMKDDRPFTIHKRYTVSLFERSDLRKDLQSWRGQRFTQEELDGFHLGKVLGAYCQLQILNEEAANGQTYANIVSITFTKEKPAPVNDNVIFDLDKPDMELFDTFSDNIKQTIQKSPEWAEAQDHQAVVKGAEEAFPDDGPVNLDDIPL